MKTKRNLLKRLLSASIACSLVIMGTIMPNKANPMVYAEGKNLISNSTFDNNISGWDTFHAGGGNSTLSREDGKLALKIKSAGTLNYSVQVFYDIIPLYKNGVYRLSYEISSTTDRVVEGMIQQNGGTYQAYTWESLELTQEPLLIDYTFTMLEENDIMSRLVFNCGYQGKDLPAHTIYLDNVVLELIDDSEITYPVTENDMQSILINQVGYKPESKKIAVFRNIANEKDFSVINADTGSIVYTGMLYGEKPNPSAGETNFYGDFSEVTAPGNYYIKCGDLHDSYTFNISENVYKNLLDDTVRMMYLQRCGVIIEDSEFDHKACHTGRAIIYGTNETIDVSGGWHDAGDYGRYVVPATKTIADMLYAYDANPSIFGDDLNIPESGNGIPDILDEVRYGLTWLFKMQAESGGVYHKLTCRDFPSYIMPEEEIGQLIVTPISTTATADFAAAMAMGYEFYYEIDRNFAEACLDAAKKAWNFLEANPNLIFSNPKDISTGEYGDTSDFDERYWAAAQMYRATGEEKYLQALEKMQTRTGLDWPLVGDYGNIAILTMDDTDNSSELYKNMKKSIITQANNLNTITAINAYSVGVSKFNWGSNMTVANAGVILGIAAELDNDRDYMNSAESNLHYLLGTNPLATCFVTGYGTLSPKNPHHRPSMAKDKTMKGMLVGGVNSNLEDSAAKAYLTNEPSAKRYIDHSESYSTNEVTTYWNSSLIYLIALIEADNGEDIELKGDINFDGIVDAEDALLLKNYLLGANVLTSEQAINADINGDDKIDSFDLIKLKKQLF
ncbi:MAG: glycosyl hydrolase family 9, cellulase [Clostridiales bacterium]|nr:glycosyl hydrolase family 9, cellulase [Clostridiales bacterium]